MPQPAGYNEHRLKSVPSTGAKRRSWMEELRGQRSEERRQREQVSSIKTKQKKGLELGPGPVPSHVPQDGGGLRGLE